MFVLMLFLGATAVTLAITLTRRRPAREAVPLALRGGLATMFTMTGVTHFVVLREDLIAMVPPALPAPALLVTVTGILELAGAVGLLLRPLAAWAAGGLGLLLVAMFPANVYSAAQGLTLGGEPVTPLLPRTGMQVLYLVSAVVVAVAFRHAAVRWSEVERAFLALPRATGPAPSAPSDIVLVSRLQLRSAAHLLDFTVAALRLRRALRGSPGAVSLDLAVQPGRRTFWTWSVWSDQASMAAYTRSATHRQVMQRYRRHIADSRFRTVDQSRAPRDWSEARQMVDGGAVPRENQPYADR